MTKRNARHAELAIVGARTASDFAAVADAARRGVARQGSKLELSGEAIRLTRLVTSLLPDEPEALGLLALMLLHDARREARVGSDGALILLEDHPRAYGALKQSVALCDELGYERLASHNRMFLAFLDALAGDDDAERVLVQGIRYAESNDYTWDVLGGRQLLARLRVHQGDVDAARLEYQKLRALAKAAGNRLIADDCLVALRALGATPSQPPPPNLG